ncbi:MAG TPA: rhodanese-like domain-containing protein [Verrucomicrobiae bacterium]|nr:rhodanese-like domain-containing protein [Verrucomicrobiae bacterium]
MIAAIQSERKVAANSTMAEVLQNYPGAQRALFRKYHIGGCSSCGFQPSETLQELCARNGSLAVAEVLEHIERSHEADLQILLEPKELAAGRSEKRAMRLLDIRTREEFEAVRIDGATLFTQEIMNEMLARWPRADLLVIYDHSGKKSMDAAAYFLGHGFTNVRALRGGIDAWSLEVDSKVRRYQLE